ncbi:hypothetical protein E2C01_061643 [Portunus trituberculatus]|uniref:Uncharacterized protein n=1 Tax=Portunus trituberculatus TaxID=210409 RepID=A0A5B7HDT2_PORTR|nr:hypothetical protein [Portunus trituberculatus]
MTCGAVKGRRGRKDRTSGKVEGGGGVTGSHSIRLLHLLGKPGGEHQLTCSVSFPRDPNLPRESPSPGFAAVAWPRYRPDTREYLKIGFSVNRKTLSVERVSEKQWKASQGSEKVKQDGRHQLAVSHNADYEHLVFSHRPAGVPPTVGSQYRAHQLALWTWLVPELEAAGKSYPPDSKSWEISTDPHLFYGVVKPPDPWYFLQPNTTTTTIAAAAAAAAAAHETTTPTLAVTPSPQPTTPRVTTTLALSPTIAR